jgi:two-component system, sensor histidine kinase PdtaS
MLPKIFYQSNYFLGMKAAILFFTLLVFFLNPILSIAQRNDIAQLETQFKATPSTERAMALSKAYQDQALWYLKAPQFSYDSAARYFDKTIAALSSNEPLPNQQLAEVYFEIAQNMRNADYNRYENALENAKRYVYLIPTDERPKLLEYSILIFEAKTSLAVGNGELIVKAAALIQDDQRPEIQARLLGDKGVYFSKTNNGYEFAYPFLIKSITIYEKLDTRENAKAMLEIYNRIVWYHNLALKYDSCDIIFNKQEALLPLINNPATTVRYLSFKANNLIRRKKEGLARPLLVEAEWMSEKYNLTNSEGFIFNTNLQGVIAVNEKNYDLAEKFFLKSLGIAKKNKSKKSSEGVLQHLADLYAAKGDYFLANQYNLQHEEVALEIASNNSEKSMRESELQLSVLSKENELAQKQRERNWYVGALVAGLFLLALVYRNFRLKQKSNQQLETLNLTLATKNSLLDKRNAENELLLKEIHHRVKNNLEVVSSLLELQSAQIDDPSVQSAMLASQNRVHSMGIIHQKLYQGEHLAAIEMQDYFINLGENIVNSFNAEGRVKVECNMPKLILDVDTAISVGLITNELLTNSLKYAFTAKEKGEIKISLHEQDAEGGLVLKISDDGIGKPTDEKAKGTGFGTQLISLLTRQLGGTLTYEINNGTMVSLYFKRTKLT